MSTPISSFEVCFQTTHLLACSIKYMAYVVTLLENCDDIFRLHSLVHNIGNIATQKFKKCSVKCVRLIAQPTTIF